MKDFLHTLIKPDWDSNPRRSEILDAANLLQVGAFQLIQLAYKVLFQENLPENKINKIFEEYMIREIIPIWVTYYAKDIIKLDEANVLNGYDDKYHVYDHEFGEYIYDDTHRKRRGIQYTIIIILVFIITHFMAVNYVEVEESASFYPPYIEKRVVYPELYENKKK